MTFVQVAVILILIFEIYETLSYKTLKELYFLSKKPYTSLSSKDHETFTNNGTKILIGLLYMLLVIALLFTSVWCLSVALLSLMLLAKVLKDMNISFIGYFIIDKTVSFIIIGYTLLQLF